VASLREHLVRNWPLKSAALALACILWIVVVSEETTSELVAVRLNVEVPPTLALAGPVPELRALVSGPGREVIKLYAAPLSVRAVLPATAQPPRHRIVIGPANIEVPRDAKVTIQDVEPRELEVELDRFVRRQVPVALRGRIEAESGFAVNGPIQVTPRMVEVSGPRTLVHALDSVRTQPLEVRGVTGAFQRSVPLDTALPMLRVSPGRIVLAGRVRRL
jgi:hypothetical protein